MSNTRPFTDAHAIARLDFGIIFQDAFSEEQRRSLGKSIAKHLPQFEAADEGQSTGDFALVKKGEDDEITEEIHVHSNYVHVVWSDYRGWTYSLESAIDRLGPALDLARSGAHAIESVGLAYRDVFFNEELESYSAGEVFRTNSRFLPPFISSMGQEWRHWLQWHDDGIDRSFGTRSVLGIDASLMSDEEDDGDSVHITEINHRQNVVFGESAAGAAMWTDQALKDAWNHAHNSNAALLRELLNDEMLDRIGLKEE